MASSDDTTRRRAVVSYESTRNADNRAGTRSGSVLNNVVVELLEREFSSEVASHRNNTRHQ